MEKYFNDFSDEKIKQWISDNRVLFVTNSNLLPGTTFLASMKTYIDYIPLHNYYVISGMQEPKPFYGVNVFFDLMMLGLSKTTIQFFDYIIYIDEDSFVCDFRELMNIFYDFKKDDAYCMSGSQDGGVICHRNHSKLFVNTFLSFFNLKRLRASGIEPKTFVGMCNELGRTENNYEHFIGRLKEEKPSLYEKMNELADENIEKIKLYREEHFINGEVPYCEVVKNDPDNPIEPNQIPYSWRDDEEKNNFEPYYIVEQSLVWFTELPIYYLNVTDLFDKEETECDNTGLTSVVFGSDNNKAVVHTWYSRMYSKWPQNKVMLKHTKRINTVIEKYGVL